ncbi:choice-of-anchor J domain-containing protein [Ekhidna sp.]
MKNKPNILLSLLVFLLVALVPQMSLAQVKNEQDNIKSRPNIRFNNKKLMKMQNPGLKITDKIDNPTLRAEYDWLRLRNPNTGKIPESIEQLEMEFVKSSKSGLSKASFDLNIGLMEPGDQASPWINRGPFNVGGRTRALAIDRTDENVILAGGVSGGLWRSVDQGATWTKVTPGQEHPSITDIVQDPRVGFENIWYYGTGERIGNSASDGGAFFAGNGVYKSTDGGLTFSVLTATQNNTPESFNAADPFDLIFAVDIDPTNGNLYVATFNGVHRSTDGGATFEQVLAGAFDNESDIHITSTGVLYAALASGAVNAGIFRSTDGANGTWANITAGGFPANFSRTVVSTAPSNENILYLLSVTPGAGSLGMSIWKYTYVSGDGTGAGGVWEDRSANVPALGGSVGNFNPQGGYNMIVRVHPTDENLVFIAGTNLYRSFDGFSTPIGNDNWVAGYAVTNDISLYTNQHPDHHGLEFFTSNPNMAISSHDGGLSLTNDITAFDAGGPLGNESVTWSDLNNGYLTTQTYALSIGPGDQLQAGFQDQSTWFTNNTGSTNPWTVVAGADGSYNAFNADGTLRYVSFQNGTTFRQEYTDADSDNPLTQDFITPNGAGGFLFVNPFELDPNDRNIMYLAAGSTVWRNDNLPAATPTVGWAALTNATVAGTASAIGISTSPANVIYIGSTTGQVVRVDDANIGNPTGVDVTDANFPAGANVTSVDVNPNDANDVIVAFSNYAVVSIFRSTDGGSNWTDISGNLEENVDGSGSGPSVRWVTRIGFNDRFFAATSVGLYSTDQLNGAATVWTQEDPNGIGNVVIEQIRKRDSDGLVVLGTHGNGLYSANFEITPPPISVINPLADVEVDINSVPSIIDVSNVFQSNTDPPETLTLSVTGDNPGLVSASLSGTDLTLTYTADQFGDAIVTLTATDASSNEANDVFAVTVNPPPLIITEFPYLENFEDGEDGPGSLPRDWSITADPPYTWTVISGPTPTGGFNNATGPLVDHTTGTANGFYVYTESSGGLVGDTTELITPPVVISDLINPTFEFYYHLFGEDIVSFEVEVIDEVNGTVTNVFTRDTLVQTAQTDPYLLQIVSLGDYGDTVRVRFRGIRGAVATDGFLGDMAIDDVRFFDAPLELVIANPTELTESLEKGQTSTQILSLTNISEDTVTFDITLEDVDGGIGVSASTVTLAPGRAGQQMVKRTTRFTGDFVDLNSTRSIPDLTPSVLAIEQYASGFENFLLGDINGQDGWVGQFVNWVIDTSNPSEGSQHIRSLSDGLGQTLAFSPDVPIGTDPVSSVSARINIQGTGVTWQLIPQSNTAELVNTRLQFNPDGSIDVLVPDGLDGAVFEPLGVTTPSGYFKVDIEIDRATSNFKIFFDDEEVFSGLGFAGDIEQLVLLSLMETAGPTLDLDELQILDGEVERGVPFLSIDPASGIIPAGTSVDLMVTFDATEQDFGTFTTNIVAAINGGADESVIVPATLSVTGDPTIFVDPTVVQAVVDFNKPETRIVTIENTGGNPLDFDLSVIGADIGITTAQLSDQLMAMSTNEVLLDSRVQSKLAMDNSLSSRIEDINPQPKPLYITIGEEIFSEDFEGGVFPPAGWTAIDNEGTGVNWGFSLDVGEANYSGSGEAATVSSDAFGLAEFDAELRTPSINVAGKSNLSLTYNVNYQNLAGLDFFDLDISTDGGTTWTTLLSWNEDHGAFRSLPGEQVNIDLDAAIAGASDMILRWRYYDPNTGDFDWYAQVDDVVINENTEVWMALDQTSGTVPVGETAEIELQFDPTVVDPGFYVAGIIVNSNASNTPIVGVVVSMEELEAAEISVNPTSLTQELVSGRKASQTLTISNSGESALDFQFEDNFPNVGEVSTTTSINSTEVEVKTQKRDGEFNPFSIRAIQPTQGSYAIEPPVDFSDVFYATNFETFDVGDINLQQGWTGQFVNWVVDSTNPGGQDQHIRSVADGLGQTLAFSPQVGVGTEDISSASMLVNLEGEGATWQIIPQSPTQEFLVTRLSFDADDSVRVLVSDNGGEFQTLPISAPEGYFEVKIEVERLTSDFTIYFDDTEVFSGNGFVGSIEQIVLLGLMEVADPIMDIDNLQIVDGIIPELSLSASPISGVVLSGESLDVQVTFDATNLEGGVYEEDLVINNNDPDNNPLAVPTTLTVIDPQIIAINPEELNETLAMSETSTQTLTISNEGVADLNFNINIDGDVVVPGSHANLSEVPSSKDWLSDTRIVAKLAEDNGLPNASNDPNNTPVGRMGTVALLFEDFEDATFPPADWTVIDNEGTGVTWLFAADAGEGNYSGSGEAATVSSDAFGVAEFDAELITPVIDVDGQTGLVLEYLVNYQNLAGLDFLDVDISTDGGTTWNNMLSWNEDHGSFFSTPGELVSIDLDSFIGAATSFQVRWRYYDPNTGDFDWYAQIDDVVIGVPWLSLDQTAGVVPGGSSIDIEVTFDATVLEVGTYTTNLVVCSDDLRNPEQVVPATLTVLTPPTIVLNPDVIDITLFEGFTDEASVSISNSGGGDLNYDVISIPDFVTSISGGIGVLEPGDESEIGIQISAESLLPGIYNDTIRIESNDPNTPIADVVINLTVEEFIVLDMIVEAICSDNPDVERTWKVTNPNIFERDAFWFLVGTSEFDDILLEPGENFISAPTQTDRPNTLNLRWLDEDDVIQDVSTGAIDTPCEVVDLNLTSVCSNNPDLFRRWRVRNMNSFRVMVTWEVVGTSQTSSLWVDGGTDTFFFTFAVSGPNTTIIKWLDENGDEQQNTKASGGEMCDVDNSCNAGEVVAFNQGLRKNGKSVLSRRSITSNAIGSPEENDEYNFLSLGFGGSVDIKLTSMIVDQPGNDFRLIETSFNDVNRSCESYPETADVYVSMDGIDYIYVGSACKDEDFDIATSGLMEIEYVRIVDTSNPVLFGGDADGFDVDGIHCINNHFSGAAPVSFGLANIVPDEEDDTMIAYPNPFDKEIGVKMKVESKGKYVVTVHDNQGVIIAERVVDAFSGQVSTAIDAGKLANGVYIITVTSEDGSFKSSNTLIKR